MIQSKQLVHLDQILKLLHLWIKWKVVFTLFQLFQGMIMKKILLTILVLLYIQLIPVQAGDNYRDYQAGKLEAEIENKQLIVFVNNPTEQGYIAQSNDLKVHVTKFNWSAIEQQSHPSIIVSKPINGQLMAIKIIHLNAPVQSCPNGRCPR